MPTPTRPDGAVSEKRRKYNGLASKPAICATDFAPAERMLCAGSREARFKSSGTLHSQSSVSSPLIRFVSATARIQRDARLQLLSCTHSLPRQRRNGANTPNGWSSLEKQSEGEITLCSFRFLLKTSLEILQSTYANLHADVLKYIQNELLTSIGDPSDRVRQTVGTAITTIIAGLPQVRNDLTTRLQCVHSRCSIVFSEP